MPRTLGTASNLHLGMEAAGDWQGVGIGESLLFTGLWVVAKRFKNKLQESV